MLLAKEKEVWKYASRGKYHGQRRGKEGKKWEGK